MPALSRYTVLLIPAFLLSCTGGPNSPSSTTASIAGTVHTASASPAANSLNVSVPGTSIATTTNSTGRFVLNNVPAGEVTLLFEGAGVNARLPLGSVQGGNTVTIVVTVTGSEARLDSRRDDRNDDEDDDDDEDEDEVEGRVSGLSGTCPNLTFTIGNTTVKTNSNTRFKGVTCGALANDMKVEAEGAFANGVLTATEIEKD